MTISSMTGFARAHGAEAGWTFAIEIKSVNGRGLDVRLRLPPQCDGLEADMRARVQKKLARGSVNVTAQMKRDAAAGSVRINEALFAELAEAAERLAWSAKLPGMTAGDLLRVPGVIETGDSLDAGLPEPTQRGMLAAFDRALDGLIASRRDEGKALAAIVAGQLDAIETGVGEAAAAEARRPESIRARLKAQIDALLGTGERLDPDRLHQEAMLIAARIDVREEIDRLRAHVDAGRKLIASAEPVGRKLDFLAQEFVREANTLCSKANDIALTRIGLDLKSWVEQFREQVQNVE
jgi:uncharacterized protein (TIGR00255 family)